METKDRYDQYRRVKIDVDEGIKLLLEGKSLDGAIFDTSDDINLYNQFVEDIINSSTLNDEVDIRVSVAEYHQSKSEKWVMPDKYVEMDIRKRILDQCETAQQIDRVNMEYQLFEDKGLIPLLQFLTYLVDYMRENRYVWGVGRGSSVASYVLYLLGVHRIDSLKYDLDIKEFLK